MEPFVNLWDWDVIREEHIDASEVFVFCFNFSAAPKAACGILVPRPEMELTLQWKCSLNH